MTKKKAEEFRPSNIVKTPRITAKKPVNAAFQIAGTAKEQQTAFTQERMFMLQGAAIKLAQESRNKAEQRKRSPIMLFDQSGSGNDKITASNSNQMNGQTSTINPFQNFNFNPFQKSNQPQKSRENRFLNNKENNSVSMVSASLL